LGYWDFLGLTPRAVRAAPAAAAVFAGIEFGPQPLPCLCSRSGLHPISASASWHRQWLTAGISPIASWAPASWPSMTMSAKAS
jgi:hypothetical protein